MKKNNYRLILHGFFKFAVIIKGIDGFMDILSSIILYIFGKNSLATIIPYLVRKELLQDPQDFVAQYLIHFSQSILPGTQAFIIYYLMLHGIIKIGLAFAFFSKNNCIHKMAGTILSIFIVYEIFRYSHTGSYVLLGATIFDVMTLILIYIEHNKIVNQKNR